MPRKPNLFGLFSYFQVSKMYLRMIILTLSFLTSALHALEEDCVDFQGQVVAHGLLYVPGPSVCSLCVCYHSEPMWCQAIYCDPPYYCKKFRAGTHCCEFECLDEPTSPSNNFLLNSSRTVQKSLVIFVLGVFFSLVAAVGRVH